jgi:glycosyltransferase involved in cell wall biosynthesis
MNKPLVSVCIIAYNHEKYIAQCIQSVVDQVTNFDFEIIIGEDGSSDQTASICASFQKTYPDKIKLFQTKPEEKFKMLGTFTGKKNFIRNLNAAQGVYIALCDGDDYWCEKNKLQKQVDTLENNPQASACAHEMITLTEDQLPDKVTYSNSLKWLNIEDVVQASFPFQISTLMFRHNSLVLPDVVYDSISTDLVLFVSLVMRGPIIKLSDAMSVYRIHGESLRSNSIHEDHYLRNQNRLLVWKLLQKNYGLEFAHYFEKPINYYRLALIRNLVEEVLEQISGLRYIVKYLRAIKWGRFKRWLLRFWLHGGN